METENSGLIGSKPLSSQKLVLLAMDLLFFTGVYNVIHYFRLGVWVEHFSAPYIGVMLIVFASLYVFDAYGT